MFRSSRGLIEMVWTGFREGKVNTSVERCWGEEGHEVGYAEDEEGEIEADGDNLETKDVNPAFFRLAKSVLPTLHAVKASIAHCCLFIYSLILNWKLSLLCSFSRSVTLAHLIKNLLGVMHRLWTQLNWGRGYKKPQNTSGAAAAADADGAKNTAAHHPGTESLSYIRHGARSVPCRNRPGNDLCAAVSTLKI